MTERLLPCPFCGGDAVFGSDFDEQFYVECIECKACFKGTTQQRTVVGWNNRRVNGFLNWLEAEKEKFSDGACLGHDITAKVLTRCEKQLMKLLNGLGL